MLSANERPLQLNQGRCAVVGPAGFEKPMCNCTRDLLKSFKTLTQDNNDIGMEGNIEIMDSPMVSDMSFRNPSRRLLSSPSEEAAVSPSPSPIVKTT